MTQLWHSKLTDLKGVDGESREGREVNKVVGAAGRGADLVVGWEEEDEGDVLVQFNHLVAVELVLLHVLGRQWTNNDYGTI